MRSTSFAVSITKFLFGKCDCTTDNDVVMGDFSLMLGILHVYGRAYVQSYVSPGIDCSKLVMELHANTKFRSIYFSSNSRASRQLDEPYRCKNSQSPTCLLNKKMVYKKVAKRPKKAQNSIF